MLSNAVCLKLAALVKRFQLMDAVSFPLRLPQGHLVVQGTYTELLRSGVDFTSLLKKDEEEEQTGGTGIMESSRNRTLSQNSVRSGTSSVVSEKEDDDKLPVCLSFIYLPGHSKVICRPFSFLKAPILNNSSKSVAKLPTLPYRSLLTGLKKCSKATYFVQSVPNFTYQTKSHKSY